MMNQRLKVALLADVHGNLPALEAVLAHAQAKRVDQIWNLGDWLGCVPFGEQVIDRLRAVDAVSIIGNYDQKVLSFSEKQKKWRKKKRPEVFAAFAWNHSHLGPAGKAYLAALPERRTLDIMGRKVVLCHGSPDAINEHLYQHTPRSRLQELADQEKAALIVCGHSHDAFVRRVKGTCFVNPGSVGRPEGGDWRAAYACLTLTARQIRTELLRVEYDINRAQTGIKEAGLPDCYVAVLREGLNLDALAAESPTPEESTDVERLIQEARTFAKQYDDEPGHAEQVRVLALALYDQIAKLNGPATPNERVWLECAAILHDIGWHEGQKHHHKTTLALIMKDRQMPLDLRQRRIVGLVARYHRRALPRSDHPVYRDLNPADRAVVRRLAALLRMADGLDRTHTCAVKSIRCQASDGNITVTCSTQGNADMERWSARKKSDLFAAVFKRSLRITED